MGNSKTKQNPRDFEEYVRDLLECPVCMDTIKLVPVYQCTNGHVICKDCIEKLNNCPICRNDSALVRNLKLENIVQRLDTIHPEDDGTTTAKPNLQKWGKGSVRVYGTINGPNQEPRTAQNLQTNHREAISEWATHDWVMPRQATSRQAKPRQATPGQAMPRQATPRQATPRQLLSCQVNNQDVEAALQITYNRALPILTLPQCFLRLLLFVFLLFLFFYGLKYFLILFNVRLV